MHYENTAHQIVRWVTRIVKIFFSFVTETYEIGFKLPSPHQPLETLFCELYGFIKIKFVLNVLLSIGHRNSHNSVQISSILLPVSVTLNYRMSLF